ncbi:MAG: hypothetical protein CUN55_15270 [Phototrophicales bacterium]|nr:MAG: hypothetical protein CUN55_15270 [Phototrophicales bacterium]
MANKIRILIVDDVQEGREMLQRLLDFEPDMEVVGFATTGVEAIEKAQELKPDVILMDINMPDMDGITATERITALVPVSVVMISVQSDRDYMRRAMRVGAIDYLPKPPSADELYSTVRNAYARKPVPRKDEPKERQKIAGNGKLIVVYSPQGGSGVTTVAVNVAVGLMDEMHRTVLVDADVQFGDAAIHLAVDMERNILHLAKAANELDPELIDAVLVRHGSGLRVLTAPKSVLDALDSRDFNADTVEKIVRALLGQYAYVVVNTPTMIDPVTVRLFLLADLLLLVGVPTLPAARNIVEVMKLFDQSEEFNRDKIVFALNRIPTDRKSGAIEPEEIAKVLRLQIHAMIPSAEKQMMKSVNRGTPVIVEDNQSPGKELRQLVEVLRARLADNEEAVESVTAQPQKRGGFLSGLLGN